MTDTAISFSDQAGPSHTVIQTVPLGDRTALAREHRRRAAAAEEQRQRERVTEELIEADDSDLLVMRMLRGADLSGMLSDDTAVRDPDLLAGPFHHVVVDEAQELTDAEWQMVLARCPSRSLTLVGDRAQSREGFPESWKERLYRVGLSRATVASLTVNYRTPEEVMAVAEPAIRAVLPDANVPTSIRSSGVPVRYGCPAERDAVVQDWLDTHPEGTACVIGVPDLPDSDRVRSLTPRTVKGLEFDLVVLVEPDDVGDGVEGAVDRYVSLTRSTRELVVLSDHGPSAVI